MLCGRTLQEAIHHLACSLNDNEGSELIRIAGKNSKDIDPDGDSFPDGVDFTFEENEESLNHIRWSQKFLTSCINDAYRILHMERPDLFNNRIRYRLKPGCRKQPLDCCKYGGDPQNDDCTSGTPINEVSENQIRTSGRLSKLFCTTGSSDDYEVKALSFNPKAPNEFTIDPVPPHGVDTYITFNCVKAPPCFEWDEDKDLEIADCLFDDYEPWFIEYSLFRAHMTDRESETSRTVAEIHWNNGFKLISDGKQSDYAFYHPDLYLVGPIKEGTGERIVLQTSN